VKSGQDSPNLIIMKGKNSEGPSALAKRIKEVLRGFVVRGNFHASQAVTPGSLQVRRGKLMEDQKPSRVRGRPVRRHLRY